MIPPASTTMEKLDSLVRGMKNGPDYETMAWFLVFTFFIVLGHLTAGIIEKVKKIRAKKKDYEHKKKSLKFTPREKEVLTSFAGPPESSSEFEAITSRESFDKAIAGWAETCRDLDAESRVPIATCLKSIRRKLGFHEAVSKWMLSSTREMAANQRITLFLESSSPVHGSVLEVDDLDFKVLVTPGSFPSLNPDVDRDSKVKIRFWRENDAEYKGVSKVLKFERMHALIFTIAHPESLKRVQQRRFLRAKVPGLPIEIFPQKNQIELEKRSVPGKPMDTSMLIGTKGTLRDISGGGASAMADKPLEEGTVGIIRIDLPGVEKIPPIGARIVSITPTENSSYRISLEFVGINEKTRELIIQFVYKHQAPRV